jgi:DNA-binding transcriptional MocR family regulator
LQRLLIGWEQAGHGPSYVRLAASVAGAVLDGRLPVPSRLPSERETAAAMGISRTTVAAAYGRLRDDGFLVSRRGAGSWTRLPDRPSRRVTALLPGEGMPTDLIDLALAAPGPDPEAIAAAVAEATSSLPAELCGGHGYHPAGVLAFREAVAARYRQRGAATSADQVLITPGAQGALHLIAEHLMEPGDVVLLEQPTYPNAVDAFRRARARLVPVPVTAGGWDPDEMARTLDQVRPRFAYLVVDFHNPTSALLDQVGRERLVAAARRSGTLLVIDETAAELSLDGQPLPPPVAAFDRDERVLTVGSMSKTFWGGLRLGWLRAGPRMIAELATSRSHVDLSGPVFEQLVGVRLLEQADGHLADRRQQLAAQRDALLAAMSARFPNWRWVVPAGGLSVWVTLDAPVSTALADAAERHRLRLVPGPRFGIDGTLERFLRLPFTLPVETLEEAVDRLAAAHADLDAAGPRLRVPTLIA